MESIKRVRKTDLARNTRHVIRAVQRGQTAVIENHGEAEAAIIDILDYRILRAIVRYYATPSSQEQAQPQPLQSATDSDHSGVQRDVAPEAEPGPPAQSQAHVDLIVARYLAGSISLARAAEMLGVDWFDLRSRLLRLDVPLLFGPEDQAEAAEDVKTALAWADKQP